MFSKPTEPRSIASQLVLLFTPAAAFLLFCGLAVFYVIVVRHAFEEDNAVLADKIVALQTSLRNADGQQALSDELKIPPAGERAVYWIRVVDANGKTMMETPGMATLLPPEIFPAARDSRPAPLEPKDYRARGKLFSLAAATTGRRSGICGASRARSFQR